MNEDILKRAMFAMPLSKEAQNSGILSGFMDEEDDDEGEGMSQEDMDLEETPVMARTPQNPEILMNNLRGDMRSLDARYVELAQMVGEEAAMNTPPEVLAMLMGQMGAQASSGAGIGALPQAQEMVPPGMEQGMQAPPPMMPPGMEGGMGPFPSGGAEQAPPQNFAIGGLAVPLARMLATGSAGVKSGAQAMNQALGTRFMAPQFTTQAMRGPGGQQLVMQGRESLRMLPGGQIAQGTGTRLTPGVTLGPMQSPTLTQGLRQGLNTPVGQLGASLAGGTAASTAMLNMFGPDQQPITEEDMALLQGSGLADRIPGGEVPAPISALPTVSTEPSLAEQRATPTVADTIAGTTETDKPATTDEFIDRVVKQEKERTKGDRIRERYEELSPLYREILGDDADARKQQALLLLAEAGFRFAGTAKPTMGMALADAMSGIPAGMAALAAQKAEREAKIKSAALSQSIEDIGAEDDAARKLQLEMLKGDYRLLLEQAKRGGGGKVTDGYAGLRVAEDKGGSFLGYSIDPADPMVQRAVTSRYTLTPNNPFVMQGGQAPQTPETDRGERVKLVRKMRDLDESLGILENIKSQLTGAYGPGAWYSSFENNMLVPVLPLNPNVTDEAAKTAINQGLNRLMTKIASADTEGRTSVFAQEQVNTILPARAGQFFQDAEVNAARFNALQTLIMNQRQETLAQLGFTTQELTMNTPSTGTKNDPFALPADEQGQASMLRFLGGTVGKVSNPNALVYIRTPDGTVRPFKASELRTLGAQ